MTIATLAGYQASLKETVQFTKLQTLFGSTWNSLWIATGTPAAGSLAIGNTANGVVPTDATTGCPTVTFASGIGYITALDLTICGVSGSSTDFVLLLYDRLFHAGSYAFNAAVTLASQPSYSSRVPGGDYSGLQLWFESASAFTGNPSVAVTYTNQAGTAGRTTGAIALGSVNTDSRMFQLPLQAGDTGIQKVESVTGTVASAGTFNIIVARALSYLPLVIPINTAGVPNNLRLWMDRTGMPQIYGDSALALAVKMSQSNISYLTDLALEIASA